MLRAQDGTVGNRGPDRLGHGDAVARCPVRKLSGSEVPLLSVAEKAGACRPFGAEDRKGISCLSGPGMTDRKSTRLNSSHLGISYAVFCLKKKKGVLCPGRQRSPGANSFANLSS